MIYCQRCVYVTVTYYLLLLLKYSCDVSWLVLILDWTLQELSRSTEVVATNGAKMRAVDVLAHALRHFSQQAVREISEQSETPLSNDDIRWVVTVPAIWTAAAKQLMRQAAYDVSHPADVVLSYCHFRIH